MLLAEAVFFGKRATKRVTASIVVVCLGVGLSTVTDTQARYLYICAGADTFHRGNMGSCRPVTSVHAGAESANCRCQLRSKCAIICCVEANNLVSVVAKAAEVLQRPFQRALAWGRGAQMGSNLLGWAVGGGAVVSTALYQIWAGTKQKELQAGSMQVRAPGISVSSVHTLKHKTAWRCSAVSALKKCVLDMVGPRYFWWLKVSVQTCAPENVRAGSTPTIQACSMMDAHIHKGTVCAQLLNEYSPIAAGMLAVLVPAFEPMGWGTREAGTLLGFEYTWPAIAAIAVSAVLGLLVSLSTFLVRAGFAAQHVLWHQTCAWPGNFFSHGNSCKDVAALLRAACLLQWTAANICRLGLLVNCEPCSCYGCTYRMGPDDLGAEQ